MECIYLIKEREMRELSLKESAKDIKNQAGFVVCVASQKRDVEWLSCVRAHGFKL